ncbi:MAG: nitrilase [Firmicutes bacterium]|nr:nitrilase [Bacillota bacterium]
MKRRLLDAAAAAAAWRAREAVVQREVARAVEALPADVQRAARERRNRYLDWTVRAESGAPHAAARLRVAAVQMELRPEPTPAHYVRHVFDLGLRAAALGAELIVFPEDAATGLVALLPGFGLLQRAGGPERAAEAGGGLSVADVFARLGPAVGTVYRAAFSALAEALGAYVVAGTANLPAGGGRVLNIAHVFAPDGRLLLRQPKLHLFPYEAEWGIQAGAELRVFFTPWGAVAAPVCMDATYFETARIARGLGAELLCLPIANPEAYHLWKARRGVWGRAQDAGVYAVQSALVGDFMGLRLEGRSAVYAPLDLSPAGDGVLVEADDPRAETVVAADLDFEALRAWRARQPRVLAPGWWRAFPDVYDRPPPRRERNPR